MGDHNVSKDDIELGEVKIALDPVDRQPPPPYQPRYQNYYYQDPSYGQTPGYQQRVGGQNVYVQGAAPADVSRGGQLYQINIPEERQNEPYWRQNEIFTDAFNTVAIRNKFVQRVYTILSVQLLVTFGFVVFVTFEKNTKLIFIKYGFPISILAMITFFGLFLALVCCESLRRQYPMNFILLAILTVLMSLVLAVMAAVVDAVAVLYAIGTTAIICFLVSIFACQTKWDVTECGMCLCIATLALLIFGVVILILSLFGVQMTILHIIYSSLAVLLFSFWLMYDTQQIVGGRRIELSPEEYIFGALSLYLDIVRIFMHLLVLYQYCLGGHE